MTARAIYPVILRPDKIIQAFAATPEPAHDSTLPPKVEDCAPDIQSLVSTLYGAFGLRKHSDELTAPERLRCEAEMTQISYPNPNMQWCRLHPSAKPPSVREADTGSLRSGRRVSGDRCGYGRHCSGSLSW